MYLHVDILNMELHVKNLYMRSSLCFVFYNHFNRYDREISYASGGFGIAQYYIQGISSKHLVQMML